MSLDTMSFILGGILVTAGLFGGALEIKELKLPKIGTAARCLSVAAGVGFIVLAIMMPEFGTKESTKKSQESMQAGSEPTPESGTKESTKKFHEPMQAGLRLDFCLEWARECGEPAATAWCKANGMSRALEYPQENVGAQGMNTRVISTSQVCQGNFCSSFAYIVCAK